MEDYKPNSHLSKQDKSKEKPVEKKEKKHLEPIATGKRKKKSIFRSFTDSFVQDDAQSIGDYILNDVLIPSFKKTMFEMITNGSEMMIFKEVGRHGRKDSRSASRVSYRSYWDDPRDRERDRDRERYEYRRSAYSFDDVEFESRGAAEEVLDRMEEVMDEYDGIVSVAQFFDLVDLPNRYTDYKYGWTSLKNARVERVSGGKYIIHFPRAMPID